MIPYRLLVAALHLVLELMELPQLSCSIVKAPPVWPSVCLHKEECEDSVNLVSISV